MIHLLASSGAGQWHEHHPFMESTTEAPAVYMNEPTRKSHAPACRHRQIVWGSYRLCV